MLAGLCREATINVGKDVKVKAIITTGGRGTRLAELTGGVFPKGLSRLTKGLNKPLVSYQLQALVSSGIKDIYLSVEHPWQEILLRQSLQIEELPPARYTFGVHKWDKPLDTFRDKNLILYIGTNDFIWTFGDMYYPVGLIEEMMAVAKQNNTSVSIAEFYDKSPWAGLLEFGSAQFNNSGKVLSYSPDNKPGYVLNPPYYFQNRALEAIEKELESSRPRHLFLQKRLINKKQLSAVKPASFINMNDARTMQEVIKAVKNHELNELL